MTTIIIGQGFIASPYGLQQHPMAWTDFVDSVNASPYRHHARFVERETRVSAPFATVAYWQDDEGNVAYESNFDSRD